MLTRHGSQGRCPTIQYVHTQTNAGHGIPAVARDSQHHVIPTVGYALVGGVKADAGCG